MTAITLPHNFTARPYQEDFFSAMNKGCKRAVLVWSRRSGKDTCAWNYMIYSAIERRGIYYYIFPTFAQGRKVLWDGMNDVGFKFIDYIPKQLVKRVNSQEMKITLSNGSLIQIVGSDNYDSIRGTNPVGCIFSEYAEQDENIWPLIISPILDADTNNGWAVFVFTPKGANHAKVLFDQAKDNPKWYLSWLTCKDTNSITDDKLASIRAEGLMSEDMIQQEHFCSFTQGIVGAYYAGYMQEARNDGRIGKVPYDPEALVHTAWDIGVRDPGVVIWFQTVGKEIRCIDYFEASNIGLVGFIKILKDKPYIYGKHYAPNDIKVTEYSSGSTRLETAANMGINFTPLPTLKQSKVEAIETVRGRFNRLWIDEIKCKRLILCLENYRKEWNDKMQAYHEKPLHDWASHGADTASYMMLAVKLSVDAESVGISDNESDRMMDRFQPRFS